MSQNRSVFRPFRPVMLAAGAALVIAAAAPGNASAASVTPVDQGVAAGAEASGATDFSARRRYVRRYYRGPGPGGAAAAAAIAGIVGAGVIASQRRGYYDGYAPGYYGPSYYGGPYYGGPGYYGYDPSW